MAGVDVHEPARPDVGHEERDITAWPIVAASVGLLILTLLIFVAMAGLFWILDARHAKLSPPPNPLLAERGEPLPPAPRLQVDPIKDLRQLRAAEKAILESYGWVDVQAGIIRIPIARAMELLAQSPPPSKPAGAGAGQ
jgi:hypothetical protein